MSNPLLIFWQQLFGPRRSADGAVSRAHLEFADQASATIFLIMRRMRTPLIMLILVFSDQRGRAGDSSRASTRTASRPG